jgi:hypothetical protein
LFPPWLQHELDKVHLDLQDRNLQQQQNLKIDMKKGGYEFFGISFVAVLSQPSAIRHDSM